MANNSTVRGGGLDYGDEVVYLCDDDLSHFATISAAFFILIFIFSVTGNSLLLCIVFRYEDLKNVTNLFVLNLACSDLVFTVTLPFWAIYQLHYWMFGDFACKFLTAAYFAGYYSSIILLTAMTVDRFITVVLNNWPSKPVKRTRCAVGACVAAWVISIAASVSDVLNVSEQPKSNSCEALLESSDINLSYGLQVSLLFFVPFAIIIFCYSAILKTVLQASNRKRYRTVVVVLCIVAVFFICWGPYNLFLFVETLYEPNTECYANKQSEIAYTIFRILAYSHCCMNPLLYMLSQKLRRHLMHILHCDNVKRRNRERATGNSAITPQNSAVMLELQIK
ncbi:chemokine XC receptor 1-like [Thunnus maccoyii]|uniref:chemokine XC receptor 1-like n=1 Tax=Thunnus maccoyii TaxID=8240 RepID=UPI001C4A89C2|nr:chemokine XC receptor 1-like [Thunnus maccoyii]